MNGLWTTSGWETWRGRWDRRRTLARRLEAALLLTLLPSCNRDAPPAMVEGTLRLNGQPLEQCLINFLPEPGNEALGPHSTAVTDQQGHYCLRLDDQRIGASLGWHRVLVQDLTVSTGVVRRDHGPVDREIDDSTPRPARRSRLPARYASLSETPLRFEVVAGPQIINLEIEN